MTGSSAARRLMRDKQERCAADAAGCDSHGMFKFPRRGQYDNAEHYD